MATKQAARRPTSPGDGRSPAPRAATPAGAAGAPQGRTDRTAPRAQAKGKARVGTREAQLEDRREAQTRFLEAYAQSCTVLGACRISGVGRRTHYDWLDTDEAYVRRFTDAKKDATDALLQEAVIRARVGVQRPVYQGGRLVGHVTEKSDTLMCFLLKGLMPETFRERVEHTGGGGGPVITRIERVIVEAPPRKEQD